jgi:peptidoglycan/LPS O-acetylase OafA/YrhL
MRVLFYCISLASLAYWGSLIMLQRAPNAHIFGWPRALGQIANLTLLPHGCYFALGGSFWLILRGGLKWQSTALAVVSIGGGLLQAAFFCRATSQSSSIVLVEAVWLSATAAIAVAIWQQKNIQRSLGQFGSLTRLMGLTTYPLYLLHDDAGMMVRDGLLERGLPLWACSTSAGVIALAMALAIAAVLEPALQHPLRRVLNPANIGGPGARQPATQEPV